MKLFTMYVGTEHSLEGTVPSGKRNAVLGMLKSKLADEFGGYSMDENAKGGYRLASGTFVEEGSARIEVVTDKAEAIRDVALWVKGLLAQESVLVTSQQVEAEFV